MALLRALPNRAGAHSERVCANRHSNGYRQSWSQSRAPVSRFRSLACALSTHGSNATYGLVSYVYSRGSKFDRVHPRRLPRISSRGSARRVRGAVSDVRDRGGDGGP